MGCSRCREASLAQYPEGRDSTRPAAELVLAVPAGHGGRRFLDEEVRESRRFHDPLPAVARQILTLLGVDPSAYGLA
jgi:hypothetical protein